MNKPEFVSRVQRAAALTTAKQAERWSVEVVRALVHGLSDSEARRHFASQLPGFLKSHVREERPRNVLMTRDAFLQHLGAALEMHAPDAQRALTAVVGVLKDAVSAGQVADLQAHLPREIAALLARRRPGR